MLLADWLNALIYEMATRDMLFARFAVRRPITRSRRPHGASASTGPAPAGGRSQGRDVHRLAVARRADGQWVAQCVVDV